MAAFSKHSVGLSVQCAVALAKTLAIDGEFLSCTCSVDAGFILVSPLHHRDLTCSIGVSMKSYLRIMLLA